MSHLTYVRIRSENDPDIPFLTQMYQKPEVAEYLAVSEAYFRYVTTAEDVHFCKVYVEHQLAGTLHLEKQGNVLSLAILIFPAFQGRGLGTGVLRDVQADSFGLCCDRIEAAIDESNDASIRLFERAGFTFVSREEELLHFAWPGK